MDTLCGPLNYTDADREGLLIEGFDELSTLFESYNYPYYKDLIEDYGLVKEVDWYEFHLTRPDLIPDKLQRIIDRAFEANNLHLAPTNMSKRKYINKYGYEAMNVLNEAYKDLYGVVPLDEKMKRQTIDQARLILRKEFLPVILDKNEQVVGFGLCMPSITKALVGSSGSGGGTSSSQSKWFGKKVNFLGDSITLQGKESIYEQIRDQITKFVKLGVLKPDDKLPSVRTLAMELGINPNTVKKAYDELEHRGTITTISTKGTFISEDIKGLLKNKKGIHNIFICIPFLIKKKQPP